MPSYFPENNTPLPTDTVERSLQKAVSLISSAVGDDDAPTPSDSNEILAQKLVRTLSSAASAENSELVEEAPEDGTIYGRKDADWVDITEPANLQVRRGTAAEVAAITPLEGEPVWETDSKILKIGDGSTNGGVLVSPTKGTETTATYLGTENDIDGFSNVALGSIAIDGELELRGFDVGEGFLHVAGNNRGSGAIDLQLKRSAATQVASGELSNIIGGVSNTASGNRSVCIGGLSNDASGGRSLILGGTNSTASGLESVTIGSGTSTDFRSICLGGGTSSSTRSLAIQGAIADKPFMISKQAGGIENFEASVRGQSVEFGLRAFTNNGSPTEMALNQSSKLTITSNTALFGTIEIAAIESTNATEAAHYIRKFAIQNLGGTTSLIGTVTTVATDYESDAGYEVSITADNTGNFLKVEVTGDSTKTLRWVACVRGIEIAI